MVSFLSCMEIGMCIEISMCIEIVGLYMFELWGLGLIEMFMIIMDEILKLMYIMEIVLVLNEVMMMGIMFGIVFDIMMLIISFIVLISILNFFIDGFCGVVNGGIICFGMVFGDCCFEYGYCGDMSGYCGLGC